MYDYEDFDPAGEVRSTYEESLELGEGESEEHRLDYLALIGSDLVTGRGLVEITPDGEVRPGKSRTGDAAIEFALASLSFMNNSYTLTINGQPVTMTQRQMHTMAKRMAEKYREKAKNAPSGSQEAIEALAMAEQWEKWQQRLAEGPLSPKEQREFEETVRKTIQANPDLIKIVNDVTEGVAISNNHEVKSEEDLDKIISYADSYYRSGNDQGEEGNLDSTQTQNVVDEFHIAVRNDIEGLGFIDDLGVDTDNSSELDMGFLDDLTGIEVTNNTPPNTGDYKQSIGTAVS